MSWDRVSFAARRRKAQDDIITALEPVVKKALADKAKGAENWWAQIVDAAHTLFDSIVTDDGGEPDRARTEWAHLSLDLAHSLVKTKQVEQYSETLIATWVSSNILSYATEGAAKQADEPYLLEWISMHDSKVRHTHRDADGQKVRPGFPFHVGTSSMRRPGDTTAPINEWINCRCTVAPVPVHENEAASVHTDARRTRGVTMKTLPSLYGDALVAAIGQPGLIPWHGPLAPEGKWSGDRRRFKSGSLSHRDLPLPLTYQPKSQPGHDGNETIASIDWIDMRDGVMHGGGVMLPTEMADEVVGLLAHFGKYGVSIDGDMAEMALVEYDGGKDPDDIPGQEFSNVRVSSACVVSIPAFQEAYVTLGEDPDHDYGRGTPAEEMPAAALDLDFDHTVQWDFNTSAYANFMVMEEAGVEMAISEKPWSGASSRFTIDQWKASCILSKCSDPTFSCYGLPIKEPNGDLSRAGVHSAAARINQVKAPSSAVSSAKSALRSAYKTLGEDPPESLALVDAGGDSSVAAARGPGWVTDPADTERIHAYWTRPGEPGYEKIGWGSPGGGDFNRCRVEVGKEIAEHSPDSLRFLNQTCAQWHHDATGAWPGHAPGEHVGSLDTTGEVMAPALSLVASVSTVAAPPGEWFTDPGLDKPTPLTFEDVDGMTHFYGHVSDWTTCHMAFNAPGQCVTPVPSKNGYAYYRVGEVMTTHGPVPTGPLTLATGHAGGLLAMRPALAHYDNTGTAVADVACGDDEHGIWVNGWVRPWISDEKKYELRAHPPSIDLRRNPNTGDMDLIAILSVNAPGLPVTRMGVEDGVQMSLIASLGTTEPEADVMVELAEAVAVAIEKRQQAREEFNSLTLEDA